MGNRKIKIRKEELEKDIKNIQRELQEIAMISNDYWNRKEQMMRDFNYYEGECEEK